MPSETEIAWLAGLLEGEGSFGAYTSGPGRPRLRVYVEMTDEDVVLRAHGIMCAIHPSKTTISVRHPKLSKNVVDETRDRERWSDSYTARMFGAGAEAVMRAVQPHMGNRRREKINAVLALDLAHHSSDRKATV